MLHYWEWIRNNINPQETIIDLGYGDGNTWKMGKDGRHDLKPDNLPEYKVIGVEFNKILASHPIINDDLCKFIKKHNGHYDVAVMSHVLEHVACPTQLVLWALFHAKRSIVVVPLGEDRDLMEKGDEMALNNPWIKYIEFYPDSICPHNAHIRVFYDTSDVYAILPPQADIIDETIQITAEGVRWYGAILRLNRKVLDIISNFKVPEKSYEKLLDAMYMKTVMG